MTGAFVIIYWRPGCSYCSRLFRALEKEQIAFETANIWEDPDSAAFVRTHNRGNETVPTVVFSGAVITNPEPRELIRLIRSADSRQ